MHPHNVFIFCTLTFVTSFKSFNSLLLFVLNGVCHGELDGPLILYMHFCQWYIFVFKTILNKLLSFCKLISLCSSFNNIILYYITKYTFTVCPKHKKWSLHNVRKGDSPCLLLLMKQKYRGHFNTYHSESLLFIKMIKIQHVSILVYCVYSICLFCLTCVSSSFQCL